MVRKTHTKSRKGCVPCKRRHVKCDETTPQCGACVRLEIRCEWSATPATRHSAPSPGGTSLSSVGASTAGLAVTDLKLLHFWIMNTSLTMSAKSQEHVWQNVVVELGFQHHFLLRGVLACAAVHMATIRRAESEDLLAQSSAHMDVAINALRVEIEGSDPATCAPVFALACLLVIHTLGVAQVQSPPSPLEQLLHMMQLIRGVHTCAAPHWGHLINSEMAPVANSIDRGLRPAEPLVEVLQLKDLIYQAMPDESELRNDYVHAVDELHLAFQIVYYYMQNPDKTPEKPTVSVTIAWVALVRPAFIERLYTRDELALILLAYYAVLFRLQDGTWWMREWAGWILDAVRAQVGTQYGSWLRWPLTQIPRSQSYSSIGQG